MRVMIFDGRANKRGGDEQVIADDFSGEKEKSVCGFGASSSVFKKLFIQRSLHRSIKQERHRGASPPCGEREEGKNLNNKTRVHTQMLQQHQQQ